MWFATAYRFSCWFSRHFMNKRQPPAADTPNISWKPSNMVYDSEFLAGKVGIRTPPSSSADKSEQRQQKRDISSHLSCLENACSRTLARARVRPRQSSPSSVPRELVPPLSWTSLIRPSPPLAKHLFAGEHAARQSRRGHQTYSKRLKFYVLGFFGRGRLFSETALRATTFLPEGGIKQKVHTPVPCTDLVIGPMIFV